MGAAESRVPDRCARRHHRPHLALAEEEDPTDRAWLQHSACSRLYQIARKGSVVGAFAEGAVRDLLASGQIKPDDDYWTEGMPGWQKVSDNPAWR